MPMVLLSTRIMVDIIFTNFYPKIHKAKKTSKLTRRLINGVITELLDPLVYYSRFSFLESGKDALDLKLSIHKGVKGIGSGGPQSFYQRSVLNKSLIPNPTEGTVRSRFLGYQNSRDIRNSAMSQLVSQSSQMSKLGGVKRESMVRYDSCDSGISVDK